MVVLNPYSIGPVPTFDPCEKCLIKVCCSETCDGKFRWNMANVKPSAIRIRIGRKRRKKKC